MHAKLCISKSFSNNKISTLMALRFIKVRRWINTLIVMRVIKLKQGEWELYLWWFWSYGEQTQCCKKNWQTTCFSKKYVKLSKSTPTLSSCFHLYWSDVDFSNSNRWVKSLFEKVLLLCHNCIKCRAGHSQLFSRFANS